jgi:Ca2+-binding EF-hand superfamily protein
MPYSTVRIQFSEQQIEDLKEAFGVFDQSTGMMNVTDLPDLLRGQCYKYFTSLTYDRSNISLHRRSENDL